MHIVWIAAVLGVCSLVIAISLMINVSKRNGEMSASGKFIVACLFAFSTACGIIAYGEYSMEQKGGNREIYITKE